MAFVKYVTDAPAKPPIRISGTTITITETEWNKAGLQGADFVNLFWDEQTQQIGLASTDDSDENKFAAKLSRRGVSIATRKFFAKFAIDPAARAEGGLTELSDIIAFKIGVPQTAPPTAAKMPTKLPKSGSAVPAVPAAPASEPTPKRRGRHPKQELTA